ncbi:DUF6268 family outer membrane beta-barrel protein [Ancylomarina sp. DW003]|nr:DUF6268 family outer membrane beta-barrel protein [Ancylomarina sp. DW003]MDE5423544.1 DUF6268 family outer membrane beta-barrel protein [Ancylomarina sp. DW003]
MLKKYILIILVLCFCMPAFAQFEKELAGVDYVRLGDENSKNSVKFQKFSFRLTIPKRLNDKGSLLLNKFEYAKTSIDYSSGPSILKDLERFHTVSYTLGFRKPIKNNWSLIAMVTPQISSNFRSSLEWEDLQLRGLVMFTKPIKPTLRLSLGIMYGTTTGVPLPLPVFSMMWKPAPKWEVNVGFPRFGVKYAFTPKTKLSADLFMVGDNFTLTQDLFYTDQKIDNIRIMNLGGGLSLTQKLTKHLKLKLNSGYTFYRKFEFLGRKDSVLDYNLDNDMYFKVGLSVGL